MIETKEKRINSDGEVSRSGEVFIGDYAAREESTNPCRYNGYSFTKRVQIKRVNSSLSEILIISTLQVHQNSLSVPSDCTTATTSNTAMS